ncbi:MAG TPA: universal stress protein [Burkholderiales bacterium]|nr:universal stress protein [Burkholderiales bacterium]
MAYKTILVHLDAGKGAEACIEVAFSLAQKSDAHVVGLHALTVTPPPSWAMAEAGVAIEATRSKALAEIAARARGIWDAAVRRANWSKSEWRSSAADALEAVTLHARYADLVVIAQDDGSGTSGVSEQFAQRLLLAAGRPVLVVPYAREKRPIGEKIVVAWNAGRESTRAVTDALPLLQAAKHVNVASFNPGPPDGGHGQVPGADIALFLSRHGVRVTVSQYRAEDIDVGNQLLSRVSDLDADLVVMGAYGRSRVSELILGGVTRTLLESMTVPVLMSH